jgi:hypothetical protein
MMNEATRIRASKDVVSRVVDGEAVLLDLESGKYFGLNEVGARVWEHVQEETTVGELLVRLLDEFDVEAPQLEADIEELLTELDGKGLIAMASEPMAETS